MREHGVEVYEQRPEHRELLPVGAFAERMQESRGLARPERDAERVGGAEARDCFLHGDGSHRRPSFTRPSRVARTCSLTCATTCSLTCATTCRLTCATTCS